MLYFNESNIGFNAKKKFIYKINNVKFFNFNLIIIRQYNYKITQPSGSNYKKAMFFVTWYVKNEVFVLK